jgi:hypothetical protein
MNIQQLFDEHPDQFSPEFIDWFPDNIDVWVAFVNEAKKVLDAGYKHYSARTIIHVIRHHSAVAEKNSEWKINNNHSPYLARLFALLYPQHKDLFNYRQVKTKDYL